MSAAPPRVVVTGAGVVSALGGSRGELGAALAAGTSGLAPVERPLSGTGGGLAGAWRAPDRPQGQSWYHRCALYAM